MNRKATSTYKIPDTDVVIEKGTLLFIPTYSLHHDPDYYPDPETFDPNRFSESEKQKRKNFTYMPFGDGPKNCIGTLFKSILNTKNKKIVISFISGLRFGLLQTKIGLCLLLKNYLFTINQQTKVPVEFDPLVFVIASKEDIILNVEKIS